MSNGKRRGLLALLLLAALLLSACGAPAPGGESGEKPAPLLRHTPEPVPAPEIGELSLPELPAGTAEDQPLREACARVWAAEKAGDCRVEGDLAMQPLTLTLLDTEKLSEGLDTRVNELLAERVAQAASPEEVYGEDRAYRPEILREAYERALGERLERAEDYCRQESAELLLHYADGAWTAEDLSVLCPDLPEDAALYAAVTAAPEYVPFHYTVEENALCGPVPDESRFLVTDDPAEVEALLETEEARRLIGEQSLVWNPELELFPGSKLRCYLDETILCIVWQEVEAREVGTFSEIIVSDPSQLRRKISGDVLWSFEFRTASRFAQEANAVLALGGDFYYHGRACGIGVYQRELYRFEPWTCDNCYITSSGDMLFTYRGQILDQGEAEQFIRDNDVLFSLCFGPVLIDDGVDVTPESYPWGEVQDEYARSALGMLGPLHYLTMNLNHGEGEYYYLATLRQEADAMIKRGCVKAYALDGGQTATTVFHGQLVNPVQFGWEKDISDVIYFCTALPSPAGTETEP